MAATKKKSGAKKSRVTHVTRQRAREDASRAWRERFIAALRNSGNVRASCQAAGVSRVTAYRTYQESEEFAREWDEALEEAIDTLEAAAWQRARDGVTRTEPIMYQGQKVGERVVTEYSDQLLVTLLKAHRPEKYKERVDSSGSSFDFNSADLSELNAYELERLINGDDPRSVFAAARARRIREAAQAGRGAE